MKYIVIFLPFVAFIGCDGLSPKPAPGTTFDSLRKALEVKYEVDQLKMSDSIDNAAPLKIIKSFVTYNSIGSPEANVIVKNVSGSTVDGYKIQFVCYNNFDEILGLSDGIDQDILINGRTAKAKWDLYSYSTTKKVRARIYQVHFKIGGIWKNESKITH